MIEITANIEIISDKGGKIDNIYVQDNFTNDLEGNNISNSQIPKQNILKKNNPFILEVSKLDSNYTYSDNVDYFIAEILPTNENPLSLKIFAQQDKKIETLNIVFDTFNNVYPSKIMANGIEYILNSPKFLLILSEPTDTINITMYSLNKENYPLVLQGVHIGDEINIDKKNLISFESSIFDRANYKLPSYGIISNSGNIEFNDVENKVIKFAENNMLTSDLSVKVYINNTLYRAKQQIAELKTDTWTPPSSSDKRYSVSLKDDLQEWQEINIPPLSYDPLDLEPKSFKFLYDYLYSNTPSIYKMQSFDELDVETKTYINNLYIQYPLLNGGTLWQGWDKFCQATQCHIYKQNNITYCKYNGGN